MHDNESFRSTIGLKTIILYSTVQFTHLTWFVYIDE